MSETTAANDGRRSQMHQPGPVEEDAVSQCPICLRIIKKAAFVAYCMHCFCFACIRRWTSSSATCPVCRQEVEILLHSVQGEDDYVEYMVGVPPALRRTSRPRTTTRSPQHSYNLRSRTSSGQPSSGTSGPAGTSRPERQSAAPERSSSTSQQAPSAGPSREPTPPRTGEHLAGSAPALDPRDGTL